MHNEHDKFGPTSHPKLLGLSIVSAKGRTAGEVVQCSGCLQQAEYTDAHQKCDMCGTALNSSESFYSGYEPTFVPISPEVYLLRPPVRTVDERRHARIPCRNAKACIKTEHGLNIVNLVNISRGGVCFTSDVHFRPGTRVLIATHYIEGGHNIYQEGTVVRMQSRAVEDFLGEYAIGFACGTASQTR
jgi:hypothetical protein